MIFITLVIGLIHGKWVLTQIPQNKHKKSFFQGSVQKRFILTYISNPHKLPRQVLVTIYNTLIRPHLDYGYIVYDKSNNETFINKIETTQYDAALAIGIKLRTRLGFCLSHLNKHKF